MEESEIIERVTDVVALCHKQIILVSRASEGSKATQAN
jgi:hypothetical protein